MMCVDLTLSRMGRMRRKRSRSWGVWQSTERSGEDKTGRWRGRAGERRSPVVGGRGGRRTEGRGGEERAERERGETPEGWRGGGGGGGEGMRTDVACLGWEGR